MAQKPLIDPTPQVEDILRMGMKFNDGFQDYYVYSLARRPDGSINMILRRAEDLRPRATAEDFR